MIIKNIIKYFKVYIYTGIIIGVIVSIFVFCIKSFCEKLYLGKIKIEIYKFVHSIMYGILALYLYFVIAITLLSRTRGSNSIINLKLFSTFCDRIFIYENIILFVPLGVLLYILMKPFRNIVFSMVSGMLFSLFIELMQLIFRLGRFELDDIVTNSFGMLFGCLLMKVIRYIFKATNITLIK